MPLSHSQLWSAIDGLARREGLTASGLARRAGLDATSFNPSKRFGPGDPPRPRWPSTESLTRILQATGVSLGDFATLARDATERPMTVPLLGMAQAGSDGFFDDAGLPIGEGWDETELPRPTDTMLSLRITGDSMAPLYRAGDRIVVDLQPFGNADHCLCRAGREQKEVGEYGPLRLPAAKPALFLLRQSDKQGRSQTRRTQRCRQRDLATGRVALVRHGR